MSTDPDDNRWGMGRLGFQLAAAIAHRHLRDIRGVLAPLDLAKLAQQARCDGDAVIADSYARKGANLFLK